MASKTNGDLTFYLNGEKISIDTKSVAPQTLLVDYLREQTRWKGTKLGCGEGGCGACAVTVTYLESSDGSIRTVSANACLKPLAACDGLSITTADGLNRCCGGGKNHPIADRLHKLHGSQCGYCTPGMVMAIYAQLKKNGGKADAETMEEAIDGNICRCTGYRPILDTAKSFATDSKVVDHIGGEVKSGPYDAKTSDPDVSDDAFYARKKDVTELVFANGTWIRVGSLKRARELAGKKTRFLVGDTCKGVYKNPPSVDVTIDIRDVPELRVSRIEGSNLILGAARTLNDLRDALGAVQSKSKSFEALVNHIGKIASNHVRNQASIAGNLVMARENGFLSDLAPIMQGAGATLSVLDNATGKLKSMSVETFLSGSSEFQSGDLIVDVRIPMLSGNVVFRTYRSAVRPRNCHAILNSAMMIETEADGKIKSSRIVFNGVMKPDAKGSRPVRAAQTEAFLKGKSLRDAGTIASATSKLCDEIGGMLKGTAKSVSSYEGKTGGFVSVRLALVRGFFTKFAVACNADKATSEFRSASRDLVVDRGTVECKQEFPQNAADARSNVYKPRPNMTAHLQVRGKAVYVGDIQVAKGTGYGYIVTTSECNGKIKSIDTSEALKMPGVIGFVDATDIVGKNSSSPLGEPYPFPEQAFPQYTPTYVFVPAGGKIGHYGQFVGCMIARTRREAKAAASRVKIEYESVGAPVLTIEDALKKSPGGPCPDLSSNGLPTQATMKSGDAPAALKTAKNKINGAHRCGSQKHFYMETQSSYAYIGEGGTVQVHSSNQWPQAVQDVVCAVLGLPQHKVNVNCNRLGGGFGGKLVLAAVVAAISSLSAKKFGIPVMLQVDRNADMRAVGGREEMAIQYEVSHQDDGKVDAVSVNTLLTGGHCVSLSWFANISVSQACSEAYGFPNFYSNSKMVFTNKCPRSAVRGPGEIEASTLIETIMEHVAHATGKSAHEIREINILRHPGMEKMSVEEMAKQPIPDDPEKCGKIPGSGNPAIGFTIPKMWKMLEAKCDYLNRSKLIKEFNAKNFAKKRGIAMIPIRYGVNVWKKSALVSIFKDGTVIVKHGAMQMGQGCNIKIAQCVADVLGSLLEENFPLDRIDFAAFDSHTLSSQTFTGGSTGTEGAAVAAMKACKELVESFKPIRDALKKKASEEAEKEGKNSTEVTWPAVCAAAEQANLPMSALGHHGGEKSKDKLAYNCYGVGCSEVELDVLTGEVLVLRTDIMYDSGKSLNPMVDIGQAEGAFTMGMGFIMQEEVCFDEKNGSLLGHGTWEYKPPQSFNTPRQLNVTLLKNEALKGHVLSSKASGEPPLVLSSSILCAMRQAIASCRSDAGFTDFFELNPPCTTETVLGLVAPAVEKYGKMVC